MNNDILVMIYGVKITKKETLVGRQYRLRYNSYIQLMGTDISGRLKGCVVEIVSDPFQTLINRLEEQTCIYVRSLDSGLYYQVPFDKDCLESTNKTMQPTIIGRKIKVNDNSFNICYLTEKWCNLFRKVLTIVSKPYLWYNKEFKKYYIMVDVADDSGILYRILFNEDGLIDDYNLTFCP